MWEQVGVTYDWRLAVPLLEQRDGYFTKLKAMIEGAHKLHKWKVSPEASAVLVLIWLRHLLMRHDFPIPDRSSDFQAHLCSCCAMHCK